MKLENKEVEHVGQLVRIQINEAEKTKFSNEMSTILDYVDELESAPTQNVESISQISGLENIARTDEIVPSLPKEKVLQNAPEKTDNYIKVKKIL